MEKGGRRPPVIGPHESNRWQPTNHGTTAQRAVLPWSGTIATGAVLPPYGTTGAQYRVHYRSKQRFYGSGCSSSHGTTARAVLPHFRAVLPHRQKQHDQNRHNFSIRTPILMILGLFKAMEMLQVLTYRTTQDQQK